jgi:hypothetical protein
MKPTTELFIRRDLPKHIGKGIRVFFKILICIIAGVVYLGAVVGVPVLLIFFKDWLMGNFNNVSLVSLWGVWGHLMAPIIAATIILFVTFFDEICDWNEERIKKLGERIEQGESSNSQQSSDDAARNGGEDGENSNRI